MCGIAGVVGEVSSEHRRAVRRMTHSMIHRGPDAAGFTDDDGVCLGMRRLSVIDIEHGGQPVFSENRRIVGVFNGEIYNYQELGKELTAKGHWLSSHSDSECLPHLFEEYGSKLVLRLRGMFGLAIWDSERRTLLLGRDRVGKKPLYFYDEGHRLWFASELKAMLEVPTLIRTIDRAAIDSYLSLQYVPGRDSALVGVKKLPPAHTLEWRASGTKLERYWRLQFDSPDGEPTVSVRGEEVAERLREELLEATQLRMVSDRPVGAFLSGGLDSSAVVAAMARSSTQPVRTFSVGFGESDFDEREYAREVAALYGTEHQELVVSPDVEELLPRLARMYDEPFADSSAVPSFFVAEMASRDVTVVLNGDGGDESFGGYSRYATFLDAPLAGRHLPKTLSRLGLFSADAVDSLELPSSTVSRLARGGTWLFARNPIERYWRMMSVFTPEQKSRLYRPEYREFLDRRAGLADFVSAWNSGGGDPVNQLLSTDVETYLVGDLLPKVDISTMAVSLEARSPFLDSQLMEWAASLPGRFKVADWDTKVVLKRALEPWLPHHIIHRKKMGFSIPLSQWIRGPLRTMVGDMLLAPDSRITEYLRRKEIVRLVSRAETSGDTASQVWALLMLELWHREVLEAPPLGAGRQPLPPASTRIP